jgi:NADPH-dependent glutamate synthase beta subunit-like oxidoreductase
MAVAEVDLDKCIGCGICVESCPMDVFRLDTVVEYRKEYSPCSLACPLGLRQREYHDFLAKDMLDEAAEILRLCHPMPSVTGRICPHPCEPECSRVPIDSAVGINALERYLGDHVLESDPPVPSVSKDGRVAVVGSGPAGLAAAYFLVLDGYQVTAFEKDDHPGGLLRRVVPRFRLPEEVIDAQIDFYRKMGIVFKTGTRVGIDVGLADLQREGFGAVIVATGAAKPVELNVPGSDAAGILSAMDFLSAARFTSRERPASDVATPAAVLASGGRVAGPVAVIGGGSVALDAARTAARLGAERVDVICLECTEPGLKDSMLASTEEIEEAIAEGITIHPSSGVDSFAVEGDRVSAVRCVECLSVRNEDGRFDPVYGECVLPEEIPAETVIIAVGQTADAALVPAGISTDDRGLVGVDQITMSVAEGVFAAGDAVRGGSTVVEALATGKRAAEMAGRLLRGEELPTKAGEAPAPAGEPPEDKVEVTERTERRLRPPAERKRDFDEVVLGLTALDASSEAERCLTCGSRSKIVYSDDCQVCRLCQHYCPTEAIEVTEGILLGSLHGWDVVELGR